MIAETKGLPYRQIDLRYRELKTLKSVRKEVIHPQIPLRIPCYDLVLLTDPTVAPDRNLGLRVLPTRLT